LRKAYYIDLPVIIGDNAKSTEETLMKKPILILLTLTSQLTFAEKTLPEKLQGRLVNAHRGGMIKAYNNTIKRFEEAFQEGADIIEMDLQLSKDGVPMVLHDNTLDKKTTCTGRTAERTSAFIKKCKMKGTNVTLNTFEEVLQWANGKTIVNAEFKTVAVVEAAVRLVQKYNAYEWVYFQAKNDFTRYNEVRRLDARVAVSLAPVGPNDQAYLERALALNDPRIVIIELHPNVLTKANIAAINAAGKATGEDVADFAKEQNWLGRWSAQCTLLFKAGVQIAGTDVPAECKQQRDRFRP